MAGFLSFLRLQLNYFFEDTRTFTFCHFALKSEKNVVLLGEKNISRYIYIANKKNKKELVVTHLLCSPVKDLSKHSQ